MSGIKLAIEKDSPIGASGVFLSNLMSTAAFTSMVIGGIMLYETFSKELTFALLLGGILLIIVGGLAVVPLLLIGSEIRKLRYNGSIDLGPSRSLIGAPKWAFVSDDVYYEVRKSLLKAVEKKDSIKKKPTHLVFLIGKSLQTEKFSVIVFHECEMGDECDKPALHLLGYEKERDGDVFWDRASS